MNASPFILYSPNQKNAIRECLQTILSEWANVWLDFQEVTCDLREFQSLSPHEIDLFFDENHELNESGKFCKNDHFSMVMDKKNSREMLNRLLGSGSDTPIEGEEATFLLQRSIGAIKKALLSVLPQSPSGSSPKIKGGGWCFNAVSINGLRFDIALDRVIVDQLIRLPNAITHRKAGLYPLQKAVDKGNVQLSAVVATLELTLGELQQLQVGDVVRLEKNISEPVALCNEQNQFVCSGYLGKRDQSKAIMLAKPMKEIPSVK